MRSGTGNTTYIGSWLTMRRQCAGARRDDVADGDRGAADLAVDRRTDLGVGEIDLRLFLLCLRRQHLGRVGQHGGARRIDGGLLAGWRLDQRFGALKRQRGIRELRLGLLHGCFLGFQIGLERRLLQHVEQVALLHLGAFDEVPLFQERGDAGDQIDPVHRGDAADEFGSLGDRLLSARTTPTEGGPPRPGNWARAGTPAQSMAARTSAAK